MFISACVCLCNPYLVYLCMGESLAYGYWHGVTTLVKKKAETKQELKQALFKSKFCMLVNVSFMNIIKPSLVLSLFIRLLALPSRGKEYEQRPEWVIQPHFNHQRGICR